MFVTMIVGLYTSRVVLNTLGVEDYGIYAIVGGVISMMSFLNVSMSGATSRFITFELGRGDQKRLDATFSSAMLVHIGIAFFILLVGETAGLWFFINKLVIPEARMDAALCVYHLSIISMMISVCQVPYNACIIAHEKMDAYAYIEIANTLLKLGIVFLLLIGDYDKLILYAWLNLGVSIIIFLTYRIYGRKYFSESRFKFIWDKTILKPMLSFSGWDLYGNGCATLKQQGTNILINIFFGVALNAASGIATSVSAMVSGFSRNILVAFRPQIIKNYSVGNIAEMQKLINNATKYTLLLYSCFCVPLLIEIDYVMELWLGNVPEYASDFCRILLISSMFYIIIHIINTGISSTGEMKMLSFYSGTTLLAHIPLIYVIFKLGYGAIYAYYADILIAFLVFAGNTVVLKKQIPAINIRQFLSNFTIPLFLIIPLTLILFYISGSIPESFLRLVIITATYVTVAAIISYGILLDKSTKAKVKAYLKAKL